MSKISSQIAALPVNASLPLQTQWGDVSVPEAVFVARREKTKSRPAISGECIIALIIRLFFRLTILDSFDDLSEREDVYETEPSDPSSPTISLSKPSSKDLFDVMFNVNNAASGMTKWDFLVAAMLDAGFSARRTGGSAVCFRDERGGTGAITLHMLHPDPALDYKMLKSHARRLHGQFGWTSETFVL